MPSTSCQPLPPTLTEGEIKSYIESGFVLKTIDDAILFIYDERVITPPANESELSDYCSLTDLMRARAAKMAVVSPGFSYPNLYRSDIIINRDLLPADLIGLYLSTLSLSLQCQGDMIKFRDMFEQQRIIYDI